MEIIKINENKKKYIDLLLLADEQENMIDKYLDKGEMFALKENNMVIAECVVTKEGNCKYEIKNIAVLPEKQKMGYGRKLIEFVINHYSDCRILYAGTGDSNLTIPFYKKCGFNELCRIKNFFTDNYNHEIYEDGRQLIDMVYLMYEK